MVEGQAEEIPTASIWVGVWSCSVAVPGVLIPGPKSLRFLFNFLPQELVE